MEPKLPHVTVQLTGQDGNALAVLGLVSKAMKKAGVPKHVITEFVDEAMESDYNQLLRVCMQWVNVE